MLHFIAFRARNCLANVSKDHEPGPTLGKKQTPPPCVVCVCVPVCVVCVVCVCVVCAVCVNESVSESVPESFGESVGESVGESAGESVGVGVCVCTPCFYAKGPGLVIFASSLTCLLRFRQGSLHPKPNLRHYERKAVHACQSMVEST